MTRMSIDRAAWRIAESRCTPGRLGHMESVFAIGNGYLGLRGTPEEGTPAYDPGAVLNGFHEAWPIVSPDDVHGLARTGQTIVNATDGSIIRLFVDDEPFDVATARVLEFERALDLRIGVLLRRVEWETANGKRLRLTTRRLVSLQHRHLAAIDYTVEVLEGAASVAISSELVTHASDDRRRGKGVADKVLAPVAADAGGRRARLQLATRNSGLELGVGMDHAVACERAVACDTAAEGDGARVVLVADLEAGDTLRLSKFVAYHWAAHAPHGDLLARAGRTLDRALSRGYDAIEAGHSAEVAAFWSRSDVEIEGAPELQLAVRFNLFQLMQATAHGEGHGVAARGVTGRGYEGHSACDAEIYVIPFLVHTTPQWARQVLDFRFRTLDAARRRAREVGHRGALYPWRTITGEEASARYAGRNARYHVNAGIAYAVRQYAVVSGDVDFIVSSGAEVVIETARLWMDLGFFSERHGGRFCINGVTGPDESTTVVDNNAYTNLMARENLESAVTLTEWLAAGEPDTYARLVATTGFDDEEVERWRRAAALMHVPRHEELGIVLQDEHFLLGLHRHQVIKQADVVLATYLVGHHFTADEVRRTFDFYDPLTTADSALSACIRSVTASAVGYTELAVEDFVRAATADLEDLHGTTADGIHVAACGGTWLALLAGFAGLRDYDTQVRFSPRLPAGWRRLRFKVEVRGRLIEVDMTRAGTAYRLCAGRSLLIEHRGHAFRLSAEAPEREFGPGLTLPRAAAA